MRILPVVILIYLLTSSNLYAQDHHISGIFPTYIQEGKFSDRWSYTLYSFLATYPFRQPTEGVTYPAKANAFYIELDGTYNFTKQWSATGSYTYERVNPFRDDYRNENRVWIQGHYYKAIGKIKLKNRVRYDLRFIQNRTSSETDFNPRVRYLVGVDFPLNDKSLYFATYNEFFFNTYQNATSVYGENWAFAGIGFNLSEKAKPEMGGLAMSWIRNSERDWLHQYFLQLTFIHKIFT